MIKCSSWHAKDNRVHMFDLLQGACTEIQPWYMDIDHSIQIYKTPDTAAFSLEHDLLAFVYRGGHINLWNWKDGYLVGTCEKPSAREEILPFHASSLVFNPATNTDSLAAAYEAGQLIIFDPLEGDIKATYKADADSQTLACSPDGRTLISGDSSGNLQYESLISKPSIPKS
jgi:WD40 repeat protein